MSEDFWCSKKVAELDLLISLGSPLYFKINYTKPKLIVISLKSLFAQLEMYFPQYFKSNINYDSHNLSSHLHLTSDARSKGIKVIVNLLGVQLELEKGHHIDEYFISKIQRKLNEQRT